MRVERRNGSVWVEVTEQELLTMLFNKQQKRAYKKRGSRKCSMCEKNAVPGKKVCAEHLKRLQKHIAKARRARKAKQKIAA